MLPLEGDSLEHKVSRGFGLVEPITQRIRSGMPVFGTCASLILLARLSDGSIVAVGNGPVMGTSFHPELNGEPRFHRRFLDTASIEHTGS